MSSLDSLKIGVLRELNALLGLTNRRSKDENITQIVSFMIDTYRYRGPYTEELIRERVAKGIPQEPEGDLNSFVNSDRLNSTLIASGIASEDELGDDDASTLDRLETALVNGRVRVNEIATTSSSSSSESESDSEEEEDPDPAVRYRVDDGSEEEAEEDEEESEEDVQENEYSDDDVE